MELEGPLRNVFILRESGPGARLVFRPRAKMIGVLSDGMTGETLAAVHFEGEPLEQWPIDLPAVSPLLILSMRAS
jgi:hypothetical protein